MKKPITEGSKRDNSSEYLPPSCELIFSDKSLSIWYDTRNFVYAKWQGFLSPFVLKDNSILLLNAMHERHCQMIILDARLVKGTWLQVIPWFGKFFFPMVARKGVTRAAFVYSPDTFGQRAMERTLEMNNHFEAQAFQDYLPAENWLLDLPNSNLITTEPRNNKIIIREKDNYLFLEPEDILYLYSHEKGTAIQGKENTYFTNKSLKVSLAELPDHFLQVHRSYVVNAHYIISIKHHDSGSYHVFLKDMPKIKIPISKKYISDIKQLLDI